jgi:RNA polymerase sigma factor (sigma-70 family)
MRPPGPAKGLVVMPESNADNAALEPAVYAPGVTTFWNNSWRQIYDHFSHAIMAYARRRGLSDHSAEDVLQEVMTTLIRCQHGQEAGYKREAGSFQGWLWGVIRNRVHSVRRKDTKERPASPLPAQNDGGETSIPLPEVAQPPADIAQMEEEEWQRALLAAAMRKLRERVTPENFAIYTALLGESASPEELGRQYGKEANAVYAVKHRCEKMLLAEAQALREAWERLRGPAAQT